MPATPPTSAEPPRPPRSWSPLLTAAIVAAVVLAAYGVCSLPSMTVMGGATQRSEAAERIRASAQQTCEQGLYLDCLRLYDEAKRFDPQGDMAPDVEEARHRALEALEAGVRPGPDGR